MPAKLLLLADADALSQLRAAGMSDQLLVEGEQLRSGESEPVDGAFIERRDPAALVPAETDDQDALEVRADVERRDKLFARLLGSVVCHLVVLENESSAHRPGHESVVLENASPLRQLNEWYKQFGAEVGNRVGYRQDEYRHILILVCAEEIPNKYAAHLARLFEKGGDKPLIHASYVMLRRLNWGSAGVCHSRHAWPLSVSRLLVYLMATGADGVTRLPSGADTVTLAWRAIELVPDIAPRLIEDHFRKRLDQAYDQLFGSSAKADVSDWDAEAFDPDPLVEKQQLPAKTSSWRGDWHTFKARAAVGDTAAPKRWEEQLRANGQRFAASMAQSQLSEDPESWQQIGRIWGKVHTFPASLPSALGERRIVAGPDASGALQRLMDDFDKLRDVLRQRDAAIDNAEKCAELLEQAQMGYVELGRRFLLACVSAGIVAYASIVVFHSLLGSWTAPLLVASFGLLGALAALAVPYLIERRAGKRAVESFHDEILADVESRTINQDWHCQELVAGGHRFWAKSRAASAARRLRDLLRRLHGMIQRELVTREPVVDFRDEGKLEELGASSESPEQARRDQQREYLRRTRVRQELGSYMPDEDALDRIMKDRVERFRALWRRLCHDHDGNFAGNMPASVWIPELRNSYDGFRAAVSGEIHRQAIEQLAHDRSHSWDDELQAFLNQPYDYYLSCPVTSEHVSQRLRTRRLLLRTALQGVGQSLQDVTVDYSEVMNSLPLFGLLFDEMPIRLGAGEKYLEAVEYEA